MRGENKQHTCCFFGHIKIDKTPELIYRLTKEIEVLITEKDVGIFYFGSKSESGTKVTLNYAIIKGTCTKNVFTQLQSKM